MLSLHVRHCLQCNIFHLIIFKGNESAIKQGIPMIIGKWAAFKVDQATTNPFEHTLTSTGIPFRGRMKTWIDIHLIF